MAIASDVTWPTVSVVIPVKDDADRLRLVLGCIAAQDYAGPVQVVVADNGSATDAEVEVARAMGATALVERAAGSYAARNAALTAATGEVIAFTDSDCLPRPDWLRNAVTALLSAQRGHAGTAVAGAIEVFPRNAAAPSLGEAWDVMRGLPQQTYAAAGWAATANLVVRRSVFDQVGPFVAGLRSGGDNEWGRRATSAGLTFRYAPDAVVDHPARRDLAALLVKLRRVHEGAAERVRHGGAAAPMVHRALLSAMRPPVGAARTAIRSERLPTGRARATFVVAEVLVRWATAWFTLRGAMRGR